MCITAFKTLYTDSAPLSDLLKHLKHHSYLPYNLRSYSNHFLEKRFISNCFLIRLLLCGINCQINLK